MIQLAELRVDMLVNGNTNRAEGRILERPGKALVPIRGENRKPLAQFFGVFRILLAIDKSDRTPGIAFAPPEDFVAGLQAKVGAGSQADQTLQKFGFFLPALQLVLNQRIGLEKNRENILLVTALETEAEIILHEGVPAPFEVEIQLGKGGTPIDSKENGLELAGSRRGDRACWQPAGPLLSRSDRSS